MFFFCFLFVCFYSICYTYKENKKKIKQFFVLHVKAYVERVQFTEIVLLHDDSLWILDSFTIKCIQQTQKKKKILKFME